MPLVQHLDTAILFYFQNHIRCDVLNIVMIFFSSMGTNGYIWLAAAAAMLLTKKYRFAGVALLVCFTLAWFVNDGVVKHLVQRQRPYLTLQELEVLVPRRNDFSFTSGHTSTAFAAAYAITRANGRRWAWVYAISAMIAVSRIYVGMHYPTDVLGGMLVGTLTAAVAYLLLSHFIHPLREKVEVRALNDS